ncbi:sterol desaturase/sphingolipid hydroxylase (fatty acid hydroxylase superfamily) [Rhodobium gokarnense]|uniref:Sterol desaturase/sphingolipid hydroxylase (Fatty acid hydroxylase superfamily) n=2 Tax=Rhodobium gokarnense TaxID=364296 RepID=A0ABT3H7S3_9HYPH|nr:sterol desaturase family protein [Rhodobium gokarnense]MCW2306426.1 sterol desaturase/sphingolipid hydroxylase (fatty acid hydroxylase superfamily) [Rhodobium gokarnense]
MLEQIPGGEATVRIGAFVSVFAAMALWEIAAPRRPRRDTRQSRWVTNLAVVVIDSLVLRLLVPLLAVGTAAYAAENGYGLLNRIALPAVLEFLIAFVVLDFAIWLQHVASHKIPILWRLHRMHHADIDIDVSTALRFHPVEILLSMLWKMAVVLAIGAPVGAVILFEVVLNAMAMFNHGNVRLPAPIDAVLRRIVVTPDFHRVHHSVVRRETDSNYGFNLSIWDRLFRTYRAQPEAGHLGMTIGLAEYQSKAASGLWWCLMLPFDNGRGGGQKPSDINKS